MGAPARPAAADPAPDDILARLGAPAPAALATAAAPPPFLVVEAQDDPARLRAYRALRRRAFVAEQGLFARDDLDAADAHPLTRVLVAVTPAGQVVGGVRLHPEDANGGLGWWRGSRLVCVDVPGVRRGRIGAALVRAACAAAHRVGALRFDAHAQEGHAAFFRRLGWRPLRTLEVAGAPHQLMHWPVDRVAGLAAATKTPLAGLVGDLLPRDAWRGDDGVPLGAGTGVVACTDAITPAMVERDPTWAGWCGMLATAHDLAAMGARPLGALDALGAADAAAAARVLDGVRAGAEAFALPVLGGHTQLGVPAALAVTGLGHADDPVPAGGGRPGDVVTVTADVRGGWRPGYHGTQWDSTSWRRREDLAPMLGAVRAARPRAAKDVSMAGIVGTAGMLAEASGAGAELEVAAIPRPRGVAGGDWLTCFPGFAVVTADAPGAPPLPAGEAVGAPCGRLTATPGVRLRWPDGVVTTALAGGVTALGPAAPVRPAGTGPTVPATHTPEESA